MLNNSPNLLYPATIKKDMFHYFFNEDSFSDIQNTYAFRNRKNAFYIYDVDRVNRVVVWKFNEIGQLPSMSINMSMSEAFGKYEGYTYLTMDYPEIVIHKKQGKYDSGIHALAFSQESKIIQQAQVHNHIQIELVLDRLSVVNSLKNSEIIFEMPDPRMAQFHCIKIKDDFFFILAYSLGDSPFNEGILNLNSVSLEGKTY